VPGVKKCSVGQFGVGQIFWCMAVPGVEKCFVGQIGVGHLLGAHRGAKQTSTNLLFVLMYALD